MCTVSGFLAMASTTSAGMQLAIASRLIEGELALGHHFFDHRPGRVPQHTPAVFLRHRRLEKPHEELVVERADPFHRLAAVEHGLPLIRAAQRFRLEFLARHRARFVALHLEGRVRFQGVVDR